MDQTTFDIVIDNYQKFAKEIFSPEGEDKFKIKLMTALEEIMKMDIYQIAKQKILILYQLLQLIYNFVHLCTCIWT